MKLFAKRRESIAYPAIAAVISVGAVAAHAQPIESTWDGFSNSESRLWSEAAFWSPQDVPNNNGPVTYNVTIPNNGNIGPSLESAVTLDNLSLLDGAAMSANAGATGADLTVLGNTTFTPETINSEDFYGGMEIRDSTYTLGNLNLMDPSGVFLGGSFRIERGGGDAILQFKNADIIENRAYIQLSGHAGSPFGNAIIRDQDTLANALRNFAINAGAIELSDGHHLVTPGNFTNSGSIHVFGTAFDDSNIRTTMTVNGNLTNTGHVELVGKGQVIVTGDVSNDGEFVFDPDSKFTVTGAFTQNTGTLTLGATGGLETWRMTAERIDLAAGTTFGGRGTILADLVQGGIFAPGASAGAIRVEGDIAFESTAKLRIEIGGLTPDSQHDQVIQITQTGGDGVLLDGILDVTFINGYQNSIGNGQTFAILVSDQAIDGAFSNVANGGRLATSDGHGSFLVTYSGSQVLLSQFLIPEPASLALLAGGAILAGLRRRSRLA